MLRSVKSLLGRKNQVKSETQDAVAEVADLPCPEQQTYVIGDIHGRADLLELMLELIDAHIGGTHLSDMRLVRPYFRDGELFCYLASVGHWHDVGGAVPGNYNPAATDAFQEAFVLPPVKLARAGEINQDIIDMYQSFYCDYDGVTMETFSKQDKANICAA